MNQNTNYGSLNITEHLFIKGEIYLGSEIQHSNILLFYCNDNKIFTDRFLILDFENNNSFLVNPNSIVCYSKTTISDNRPDLLSIINLNEDITEETKISLTKNELIYHLGIKQGPDSLFIKSGANDKLIIKSDYTNIYNSLTIHASDKSEQYFEVNSTETIIFKDINMKVNNDGIKDGFKIKTSGSDGLYMTHQLDILQYYSEDTDPSIKIRIIDDTVHIADNFHVGNIDQDMPSNEINNNRLVVDEDSVITMLDLGVGVIDPIERVDIDGNIRIRGDYIFFVNNGKISSLDDYHRIEFASDADLLEIVEIGDITFGDGTTDKMIIKSDGNIGINTDTPTSKLHVIGDIRTSTDLIVDDDATIGDTLTVNGISTFNDDAILTSNKKFQFRDSSIYIQSTDDGHLDLVADILIDLNANVACSGNLTTIGNIETGGTLTIKEITNDQPAQIFIMADNGADAGDKWKVNVADGGIMTFGNDIALANTYVNHLTITPNATVTNSTFAIAGNTTIGGNLTVSGTTTTVNSTTVSIGDSLYQLANNNNANSIDIGWYGKYNDGGLKYAGIIWDSTDNKFMVFKDNQVEPTTTVNPAATGHTTGILKTDLEGKLSFGTTLMALPANAGNQDQILITNGSNSLSLVNLNIDQLADCLIENNSIWLGNDPSSTTNAANYNVAVGITALDAITDGDNNVAIGYDAGGAITTGNNNIIIGSGSDPSANDGTNQIVIGYGAIGHANNKAVIGNSSITHWTKSLSAHNVVGQPLTIQSGSTIAGTTNNIAGGNLTIQGGQGKGTGAGGDIIFQTATAGNSGNSMNPYVTALTLSDDLSAVFTGTASFGGNVSISGSNNELRFYEGANYVGFEAPALSADKIWVLPSADGSNGQVLSTNGSGILNWTTNNNNLNSLQNDRIYFNNSDSPPTYTSYIYNQALDPTGNPLKIIDTTDQNFYGSTIQATKNGLLMVSFNSSIETDTNASDIRVSLTLQIYKNQNQTPIYEQEIFAEGENPQFASDHHNLSLFFKTVVNQGDDINFIVTMKNYGIGTVTINQSHNVNNNNMTAQTDTSFAEINWCILGVGTNDINNLNDCLVENNSIWLGNDPSSTTNAANYNVAVGTTALDAITDGDNNVAIGYDAGNVITTGSNNVIIGSGSDPSSNNSTNQIVIGQGATGQGDNYAVIGNTAITRVYAAQDGAAVLYANGTINSSDIKLKKDIKLCKLGLNFINDLNPVQYKWIKQKEKDDIHHGLIAQDVIKSLNKHDIDDKDYSIVNLDETNDTYGLDYTQLITPLIKSIQELTQKVNQITQKNKELEKEVNDQKSVITDILKRLNQLEI